MTIPKPADDPLRAAPRVGTLQFLAALAVLLPLFAAAKSARGEEVSDEEITRLRQASRKIEEGTKQISFRYESAIIADGKVVSENREGYGHIDLLRNRYYCRSVQHSASQSEDTTFQKVFNEKVYRCHYIEHEAEPYLASVDNPDERYKDIPALSFGTFCNILNRLYMVEDDPDSPAGVKVFSVELSKAIDLMTFTRITDEEGRQFIRGNFRQNDVWRFVDFDPARDYHWIRLYSVAKSEDEEGIFRRSPCEIKEWTTVDGIILPAKIENRFSRGAFEPRTEEFTEEEFLNSEEFFLSDYNTQNSADDFYLHDIPDGTAIRNNTVAEEFRKDYIWKGGKVVPNDKRHGSANRPPRMTPRSFRRWLIASAFILLLGSIAWKFCRFLTRGKA